MDRSGGNMRTVAASQDPGMLQSQGYRCLRVTNQSSPESLPCRGCSKDETSKRLAELSKAPGENDWHESVDQLKECFQSVIDRMYTDWTAVALLLFTAVPLLAVIATATFFIWQKRKTPLP